MVNKEIKKFAVIIDSTTITTLVENMITIIENSIIEADSITLIKADSITITTLKKIICCRRCRLLKCFLAPLFEKSFLLDGSVKKFRSPSLKCFTKKKCPSLITKLCVIKQGLFFYVFYHKLLC